MIKSIYCLRPPEVRTASSPFADLVTGILLVLCLWLAPVNADAAGTVVAWGDSSSGQRPVPAGLSGVTAIAAGDFHTVALKSDGTVVAWGANAYGETTVPAGLSGVRFPSCAKSGFHARWPAAWFRHATGDQ